MDKNSTQYTFLFAFIICVVCSFTLALVSEGLRTKKELNAEVDSKKNILKAVALTNPLPAKADSEKILETYNSKIKEYVIDDQGNIIDGKDPKDIEEGAEEYPLYIYKEGNKTLAYAFPIIGKGLWSTLYGYFALEPDAKQVRGITFYKHGETPGLGAEIEKDWFTSNFKGKSVWDAKENELQPVVVVKGKVEDKIAKSEQQFYVDGISGATMTANGVTEMVDRWLGIYEPYFAKVRQ